MERYHTHTQNISQDNKGVIPLQLILFSSALLV